MLKQLQDVNCKSLQSALIHQHQRLLCRPGLLWPSFEHLRGQIPLQTQCKHNRKNGIRTLANNIHLHAVSYGWHWQLEVSWCWAQIQASCLSASQFFSIHRQIGLTTWTFHAIQSESCAVTLAMDQCMVRALQQGKWFVKIMYNDHTSIWMVIWTWFKSKLAPAGSSQSTNVCKATQPHLFAFEFCPSLVVEPVEPYMQTYQYVWNAKRSFFCEEFCPTTMSCPTAHL